MSNDEVIRQVSANFIPVAVNLYKVRQRKDAAGDFFRAVQRQKPQYQGVWIVAPKGEVLAAHHDIKSHKTWAQEIITTIDAARAAFGKIEPRRAKAGDPLAHRGCEIQDDGSVTAALYTRFLLGGGRDIAPADYPKGKLWHYDGQPRRDGPVVFDSITFTTEQWATLSPAKAEAGATWSVPEAVSAEFYRLLSPTSDQTHLRGRILKVNQLKGQVESIDGQRAWIRLTGQWETDHPYGKQRVRLRTGGEGVAVYDLQKQELVSLLFVSHGAQLDDEGRPQRPTGAVVEWSRDKAHAP